MNQFKLSRFKPVALFPIGFFTARMAYQAPPYRFMVMPVTANIKSSHFYRRRTKPNLYIDQNNGLQININIVVLIYKKFKKMHYGLY